VESFSLIVFDILAMINVSLVDTFKTHY
jgi:hypothetical protein